MTKLLSLIFSFCLIANFSSAQQGIGMRKDAGLNANNPDDTAIQIAVSKRTGQFVDF